VAQPVWVLSVDLQTKTATFTSGMADAAKAARGSFNEVKDGARVASEATSYSMLEARHSVMLMAEEMGGHVPRAIASFIASLGPIGPALEAAFPFLAIAVGATLLIEHMAKLKEAAEKLESAQMHFKIASQEAFNGLDDKLLEVQKHIDELRGDHLGALQKELTLIDHASLADLVHQFEILAKAADVVFGELKASFHELGIGSAGAEHALTAFKGQYELLLEQGKDKEASDLLKGFRDKAQGDLELMHKVQEAQGSIASFAFNGPKDAATFEALGKELNARTGITALTKQEVQAQQALVDTLNSQAVVEGQRHHKPRGQ
jgi:hypothetical protein